MNRRLRAASNLSRFICGSSASHSSLYPVTPSSQSSAGRVSPKSASSSFSFCDTLSTMSLAGSPSRMPMYDRSRAMIGMKAERLP